MIRFLLTAAAIGGLLHQVFGEQPARRKGNAKRAQPKGRKGPKRARAQSASAR